MKKQVKKNIFRAVLITVILSIFCALCANAGIIKAGESKILPTELLAKENTDCILILGAGVKNDGTPSDMLYDRLRRGAELYFAGCSNRIIVSGDHGRENYDEVNVMKKYLIEAGIPSEAIFMDHAGFSTYESIYRAKNIFQVKKLIVVTQEYHLYRALFIADSLGLEVFGADAALRKYRGELYREIREVAARLKDTQTVLFKSAPTYSGEVISLSGSGDITNDK